MRPQVVETSCPCCGTAVVLQLSWMRAEGWMTPFLTVASAHECAGGVTG